MHDWRGLHVRWECKYHVVITPKYRKKVFCGRMRRQIGAIVPDLCKQRGIELLEGHAMPDHIDMVLSIPPKYSIANTIGFLKGKSAVRVHRELMKERRMTGLHFWAAGYCVSTIGQLLRRDTLSGDSGRTTQETRSQPGAADHPTTPERGWRSACRTSVR
ncbi:MAG: IS200/IS605 family transposase [Planctomycetota bacterium]|jgi:putative transposase